ncbi:MAG: hypothetical protein ABIH88_03260 [Patescibacteria group bacterium]|nr:hypothetical protein [Patescibacteria group bacterium]
METEQIIQDLNLNPIEKGSFLTKLKNFSKKEKVLIILALIVCLLLLTLFVASVAINKEKKQEQIIKIIPTPVPLENQEKLIEPSLYATDSAILKIEKEIKDTRSALENMEHSQKNLDIPALDMNLDLEK